METNKKNSSLYVIIAAVLAIAIIVAFIGFAFVEKKTDIIQGQVEVSQYRVSSEIPGRIDEMRVEEGEFVHKGDTLGILYAPAVTAKAEQAEAAKQAAEAINTKANKSARHEQLQMAFEMWQKAKAGTKVMEKSYRRLKNLNEQGVVADQKLDEITAKRDAAIATESAAKAQYTMAKNGAEKEDKLAAAAMVRRANGAVNEVKSYVNEMFLIAPISGIVNEIFPQLGELVGTGAPIMNIDIKDDLHVLFNVREDKLHSLTIGSIWKGKIPAMDNKIIEMKVTLIRDMGSYATWKATKTSGDFDLKMFEVKAVPTDIEANKQLQAGMSVIVTMD